MNITKFIKLGVTSLVISFFGFGIADIAFDDALDMQGTEMFLKAMFGLMGALSIYVIFGVIILAAILSVIQSTQRGA